MLTPYHDPNYNPYPPSVLIGTAVLFIIVPIMAVSLRFYTRLASAASLGIDDWITILSMFICIGLSIIQIIATTKGGLGTHQQLVDGRVAHTEQLYIYEKTKYTYQLLGTAGLWVIKLSVLFFYRRIFSVRISRIANNVLIGLTMFWGLAFTLTVAFQCTPVSTLWDKFEIEYGDSCIEVQPFYLSIAVSDLILDLIIFIAPIPHVYHLQMPMRQKLAVGSIFLLGTIVIAIGITRIIIFQWVISFTKAKPLTYFSDITWYTAGTLFWHLAENVVGLLGCCLPTYAPLFRGYLHKRKTVGTPSHSAGSNSKGSKKRPNHFLYHQRLDEEEISLHPMAAGASSNFEREVCEDIETEPIPRGRIIVSREFRAENTSL
ncbi:hypothetical protein M434DRAFT_401328 [Hypoxylon sp. CO27-5]|nr:hypothetical protein M434DRAFT_401328 [Hypoxylon sp. CO27-5]